MNTDPIVDQYTFQDTLLMHVIFIPDEMGRTGSYLLDLNNADSAFIYTPTAGTNEMTLRKQRTINGKIAITATETPVFIIGEGIATAQQEPISSIKLFPNPATDKLIIDGLTVGEKHKLVYSLIQVNPLKQF